MNLKEEPCSMDMDKMCGRSYVGFSYDDLKFCMKKSALCLK